MNEWIAQPWTWRWWRMPGEVLLVHQFNGKHVTVTFTWCHENEWGLDFSIDGEHLESTIFHVDAEHLSGGKAVPKATLAALFEQLKARERGIRDATNLSGDPLLNAIADQLPQQEWTSGRRLRKLTGIEPDAFKRHLGRLIPRWVRPDALNEEDKYSLTLPGLIVMDAKLRSIALMEAVYQAVARCYERDEEAVAFDRDDLVACGIAAQEVPLAQTIARICVLVGSEVVNNRSLRVPPDREMIAAQVRKKVRFLEYLHHSATEAQRNPHYAAKRPWLQAPLWVERDGSQTEYLPRSYLSSVLTFHEAQVTAESSPTGHVPETEPKPEHQLPRLDVAYGEKLGDGAYGTVWEATDKLLERKLAVKFLTTTDEALDERALLRQARSLAQVTHPNLVVVYGAAWLRHPGTGLVAPAIMMELLEGELLHPWSATQRDRDSVLRVATGLLDAIAAMHAAGLHHGDLHAKNVIVVSGGQAKVIDWRYQDTFMARSTASRNEILEADQRHALDLVVSLFEKQGLGDESLELRRIGDIAAAQAFIERLRSAAALPKLAPAGVVKSAENTFPPGPARLDRTDVNENEKSEDQSELAIWPAHQADLDASEMMAELDTLVEGGIASASITMMFRNAPVKTPGSRRWFLAHRSYDNVINKWELEVRDAGFLAFRWAKFSTHQELFYNTRDLIEAVVVPIHLYELATAAVAKSFGGTKIDKIHLRLTAAGSSPLVLHDTANVTTGAMALAKADASWQTRLEAHLPSEPGTIAARLLNRALSNFHLAKDHFADPRSNAPIVRLDRKVYDKFLHSTGVKKASG